MLFEGKKNKKKAEKTVAPVITLEIPDQSKIYWIPDRISCNNQINHFMEKLQSQVFFWSLTQFSVKRVFSEYSIFTVEEL